MRGVERDVKVSIDLIIGVTLSGHESVGESIMTSR